MVRATPHALSFDQLAKLLEILPQAVRLMVFLAALTSMNIAEICGLKWKRVNLTCAPIIMDAELLAPLMAAVREQWYKGEWSSVKAKSRRRSVHLPRWVVTALAELREREHWVGPVDPVFAGTSGKPVCENAIVQRNLKPAGARLDMPWLIKLTRSAAHVGDAGGRGEDFDWRAEGTYGSRARGNDAALHAHAQRPGARGVGTARRETGEGRPSRRAAQAERHPHEEGIRGMRSGNMPVSVHLKSTNGMQVFENTEGFFRLRSKRSVVRIHSGVP